MTGRAWDPLPDRARQDRVNAAILAALAASEEAILAHGRAHAVATGELAEEVGAIVRHLSEEKGRMTDGA